MSPTIRRYRIIGVSVNIPVIAVPKFLQNLSFLLWEAQWPHGYCTHPGASGPGPSPGQGHGVVFGKTFTLTVPLSTQEY